MSRYAANLSMLFPNLTFLRRFDAAAAAGFDTVEFWWPTPSGLEGRSLDRFVADVTATGLQVGLINIDGGDLAAGERGLASDPSRIGRFRESVPRAIELACRLGCRKLNALAGNRVAGQSAEGQLDILANNIAIAAEEAASADIVILLEALNEVDAPRYLLHNSPTVLGFIERLARPNVRFQLDVYHLAMGGEDPAAVIRTAGSMVGHVQFADVPGRHEPGTGRLDWGGILRALKEVGYDDVIGLEYAPSDPSACDLSFLDRLGTL